MGCVEEQKKKEKERLTEIDSYAAILLKSF